MEELIKEFEQKFVKKMGGLEIVAKGIDSDENYGYWKGHEIKSFIEKVYKAGVEDGKESMGQALHEATSKIQ